jgi:hypothetical protein
MAADTVTVWEAALKQGWTQDYLEKQFYAEDPLLDALEVKQPSTSIGLEAITPVWTARAGGVTMVPTEGSQELNTPDAQDLNRATWKYKRIVDSAEFDTAAIYQSEGQANAVADVLSTEMEGKLSDLRKQVTRQLFLDSTGLICQCAKEEEEKTTVKLAVPAVTNEYALGYQAIRNGWLVPGQEIDIGTTTEEAKVVSKKPIVSVTESESAPAIVLGSAVKTATTDYVSLANTRSGTTSYELNGFRNITSETATLGNLNPETVPTWKGLRTKAENSAITRQMVIGLRRKIRQRGVQPDWAFTSLKQVEYLENQLFAQVRFAKPGEIDTGTGESLMIGTLKVQGHNDCPDEDFNMVKKDHLFMLRKEKPVWIPQKYGGGGGSKGILQWKPGTTFLATALEYPIQLCTNRRNATGHIAELTVGA